MIMNFQDFSKVVIILQHSKTRRTLHNTYYFCEDAYTLQQTAAFLLLLHSSFHGGSTPFSRETNSTCHHFQFPRHLGSHIPSLRVDLLRVAFSCGQIMVMEAVMKNMNYSWGPSNGWPVTDRGGGASSLPYTPTGVTGSN